MHAFARVTVCVCGGGGGVGAIKQGGGAPLSGEGGGASAPNAPPMGTPLDKGELRRVTMSAEMFDSITS